MSYIDTDRNFFGRKKVVDLLKRRVIDLKEGYRQNVALLGNRFIGKSSILYHFFKNIDDDRVTVIYLDLENKDFHYFFEKFTGSLLYSYSRNTKKHLHEDLDLLLESAAESIPQTVQVIKKVRQDYLKGRYADAFLGLMTTPEIYTNETGQFCVLIFDEFQALENLGISQIFQNLGKKIMTQKRCFYIVASSYRAVAQKILSEKLTLLFGNFETINVEPFDFQTSQKFVEYNLPNIKIGVQLRNFLSDFTGGHPLYLNLISQEIRNLSAIHNQSEIYMPLLSQAVENTLFDRWGVISRHFELIVNDLCHSKGNQMNCPILLSLANGIHKLEEIMRHTDVKRNPLKQRLTRLLEEGVVVKNGNYHYIKDKLLRYWLKHVHQRRLKGVEIINDRKYKQFKDDFNECVENFKLSSRKEFSSRIVELLHCFDDEAFDLNGRKYKLPVFQKFEPLKIKNDLGIFLDVIKATTRAGSWVIVTKKENFGESDMSAFLDEAKKICRKVEKCVIVSLNDLDENTRVRALQERVWIWNEEELNTLLTLFDQPYIVR